MLASKLNHRLDKPLNPLLRWLAGIGVTPNMLTVAGLITSAVAGVVLAYTHFVLGGVFVLLGGLFDVLDGPLARTAKRESKFGGVLDSTLDRYSDTFPLLGLLLYYTGWNHSGSLQLGNVVLCCAAITGSLLVPYVRARAESVMKRCDVGIAERAERVVILAGGLITGLDTGALWILAALTHFTVVHRLLYVRSHFLEKPEQIAPTHSKSEDLIAPDSRTKL